MLCSPLSAYKIQIGGMLCDSLPPMPTQAQPRFMGEEGTGESSSQPRASGQSPTRQLRRNIYDRLLSLGMATSESDPTSFRDKLYLHFDRFPPRYLTDLGVRKAEDVLLHRRLLADCADPGKRPVVHARFLECIQVAVDYGSGPEALPLPESRGRKEEVLVHEIIFASIDKHKLLSERSALLSDVGLNIRENHVYSTPDGFSLIIFLADGWCEEEADGLLKEIKETLARRQLRRNIYDRLLSLGMATSESDPSSFRDKLYLHFDRFPPRYLIKLGVHKAEDVLLHRRLLADCADPGKRPVVHARFLECIQVAVDYGGGPEALPLPESRGRKEVLVHEIIFASIDKHKLLSERSALLSDVGLNIREAHVYSTTDGFSLIIFLADGWCQEEADGLLKEIKETLARRQAPPSSTIANSSASE